MSRYASFHYLFNLPLNLVMYLERKVGKDSKTKRTNSSFTKSLKIMLILWKEITF